MMCVERIVWIVILNLLLHCQNKVYAITVISEEEAAIITGEGASRADEVKKN